MSRVAGPAVVLVGVLALAGCAPESVQGEGFADWAAVERTNEARFDAQLDALADSIIRADPFAGGVDIDVAGVHYIHAAFGGDTLDSQTSVAIYGNPPAVYTKQTDAMPGATIDEVHRPGDPYDYYLLGDNFASLAPTAWVRMPTGYDVDPLSLSLFPLGKLCEISGFYNACALHSMIEMTAESGVDVRRLVSVEAGGTVHSQTEITLQALIDVGQIISIGEEKLAQFPDAMFQSTIPVHFWQDADGNLLKMEMNGVFEGDETSGDLLIQAGFEVTGLGSSVEIPPLPPEWDVTTIEGSDQMSAFWDGVWELK